MKTNWDAYWENESNRDYWLKPDKSVIDFISTLDSYKIKDVLDLGCGIGRHTLYLAESGYNVTAMDSSQEALTLLKERINNKDDKVNIIKGDYLRDLFPKGSFDAVIAYNVIFHGSKNTYITAINLIYEWLRPGGLFYFTSPTRQD
jgi:tellurite methyltransferase